MSPEPTPRFQLKLEQASLGDQDQEIEKVQEYLTRYGYLTTTISPGTNGTPSSQGLFNNHPIGIWYDEGAQWWAILLSAYAKVVVGMQLPSMSDTGSVVSENII